MDQHTNPNPFPNEPQPNSGGSTAETFKVQGGQLLDKIKELIEEGTVRRIVIRQEGRTIAEFPLAIGVVGVVIAPVLAAVGVLAAMLTECTIEVQRDTPAGGGESGPPPPAGPVM